MSRLFAVLFLLETRQGAVCPFLPVKEIREGGVFWSCRLREFRAFGICQIFYETFTAL